MSRNDFIKAYILSAIQGYVSGKGRIDYDEIIEDAGIFYDKLNKKEDKKNG